MTSNAERAGKAVKQKQTTSGRSRLRHAIAWPGAALGIALIVSGLAIADTLQWRLHLVTGVWLLSLVPRALLSEQAPVVSRGLARLTLVLVLCFLAVGLQLTRNQISQAEDIHTRASAILEPVFPTPTPYLELAAFPAGPTPTPTPGVAPAERVALGTEHAWPVEVQEGQRGTIYDSNAYVLATTQDGRRSYPNTELSHIVGFDSRLYGATGVESSFDDYLSGARSLDASDLLEARLHGGTSVITTTAADVYLTLDVDLQRVAQNALGQRKGAVVLIDPRTGQLLVLASYPRFEPNQLVLPDNATQAEVDNVQAAWENLANRTDSPLINRATQGRYPPGSIIKTLTAAAAIDSGVLEFPESQITCPNRFVSDPNAPAVRNAVEGLAGLTGNPSNLRMVYAWSCNTAFAQIGLLLGPEVFSDYAHRFGLGFVEEADRTPALRDIAADVSTIANDATFLQRPVALGDTAFGQGQILTTPLDMAQMAAVIANNGALMRPYVVQEVRYGDQVLYNAQPEMIQQVISPTSAQRMRSIMQTSVQIGYASPAAIRGVSVGGKTGTAEVPYGAPHSWFVAIAPVEQPRFAIAVVIENGGEGSKAALPVARQVLIAALQKR